MRCQEPARTSARMARSSYPSASASRRKMMLAATSSICTEGGSRYPMANHLAAPLTCGCGNRAAALWTRAGVLINSPSATLWPKPSLVGRSLRLQVRDSPLRRGNRRQAASVSLQGGGTPGGLGDLGGLQGGLVELAVLGPPRLALLRERVDRVVVLVVPREGLGVLGLDGG